MLRYFLFLPLYGSQRLPVCNRPLSHEEPPVWSCHPELTKTVVALMMAEMPRIVQEVTLDGQCVVRVGRGTVNLPEDAPLAVSLLSSFWGRGSL